MKSTCCARKAAGAHHFDNLCVSPVRIARMGETFLWPFSFSLTKNLYISAELW